MNDEKASIFSQSPATLTELCQQWGEPKFRVNQLLEWFYKSRVFDLEAMTNIPKKMRERLAATFDWRLPEVVSRLDSEDGASKLLLRGNRDQVFEAVILRYDGRTSLCVSSQVGCKLACSFCQTGKLGFFRHLSAAEIIGQFCLANNLVSSEGRRITHIVFMGMGEPLDNFENVITSVNLLSGPEAFGISSRRVTVSTSGIASKIRELGERANVSLALSLHASRDDLRSELMPINRRYPLAVLKEELLAYQEATGDKITIEYILIRDKNCGPREAKELVRFLHGLRAKVNLIPFNSHPGLAYDRPSDDEIRTFQSYLAARGYPAPVRYSKGLGVSAACGQLAAKNIDLLHTVPARRNVIDNVSNVTSAAPSNLPSAAAISNSSQPMTSHAINN